LLGNLEGTRETHVNIFFSLTNPNWVQDVPTDHSHHLPQHLVCGRNLQTCLHLPAFHLPPVDRWGRCIRVTRQHSSVTPGSTTPKDPGASTASTGAVLLGRLGIGLHTAKSTQAPPPPRGMGAEAWPLVTSLGRGSTMPAWVPSPPSGVSR
jgi:hypothetical protein